MKYGVIAHKTTMNLGDDIQTYAAAKLLPSVDYILPREKLDSFKSENNEPVATVMNAWWMWQKWNWPPAESIYPLMTSIHINDYGIFDRGTPVKTRWLEGIGGDYFRSYGPVGCRDTTTIELLKEKGIEGYFSGCLTLTIPKQKKTKDAGEYVCLVDLNPQIEAKAREYLKDTGLKIKVFSHRCDYRNSDATLEERFETVEEFLTEYQNAKMVITRRLHVSLPCLALETPVVSLVDMSNKGNVTRWAPYTDWVEYISNKDFLANNFEYDFNNPKPNRKDYLPTREFLLKQVSDFVEQTKNVTVTTEELKKTKYTEFEAKTWRDNLKDWTLEEWLHKNRKLLTQKNKLAAEVKDLKEKLKNSGVELKKEKKKSKSFMSRVIRKLKK